MRDHIVSYQRFINGIADFVKEGVPDSFAWGRSIDFRSDPRKISLLPRTTKESGSTVVDMPKWATRRGTDTYLYADTGHIYLRTSAGSYSDLRTVSNSHGNGLIYYGEDDYIYYTSDSLIGRYGPMGGTPVFADDFLGSEGGVPTNTHSITLNGTTQYLSRADSASLSITSDLTLEGYIKPASLPAVGDSAVLASKWTEQSNLRSYKFDILGISPTFGDGSDGALTISTNTTQTLIDSACSGTVDTNSLTATNASFATGQEILIIQMRGTNAGTYQRTKIASYTAGTITTEDNLDISYNSTGANKAQVLVLPQYTNVTVNSGVTWTAKLWDGDVGGILAFLANGTTTINGTISGTGRGFRGGVQRSGSTQTGEQGESSLGTGTASTSANGSAGGGGSQNNPQGGGGGAGHASSGSSSSNPGTGGGTSGTTDLTTMLMGAGGGSGGYKHQATSANSGAGGRGGSIIYFFSSDLTVNNTTGSIVSGGADGSAAAGSGTDAGGGGAGAGGSIQGNVVTATLNTNRVTAPGATGGAPLASASAGGNSSVGRIRFNYATSISGTTSPTLSSGEDGTLVTSPSYQLRLAVSSNGTNVENYAKLATIPADVWTHVAVTWDASASSAIFYVDGLSIGTATGALTSINDNASTFNLGVSFDGSTAADNLFAGKMDDWRVWNLIRTQSQIFANKDIQIGNLGGLQGYFQLNNNGDDETANSNNLTATGTPVYTSDVPFSSPTTRLDLDQSQDSTGQTYTLGTSILETAAHRLTFVPERDPQKSIEIEIGTKGTGNWTITVHDGLNRTLATKTVSNAEISASGLYEFVFDNVWRPVLGQTYHFHLTSTVADGTVVTTTTNELETALFATYYQFLVEDIDFHPMIDFLNMIAIGNERYLATYDAVEYKPHRLTLPSGYRIRSFAKWREYLAIGVWRGTSVKDFNEGYIFFWDGFSPTYNFYILVPEGAINAMTTLKGDLHTFAGYQGDHLVYQGGDGATKIKRVPKMTADSYVDIFPGALTHWRTLLHYGVAGDSDSSVIERGVYSWGSLNRMYQDSLGYDYPISTGSRLSTVKVGLVTTYQDKLLIGWRDGTSYGVDVVDPAGLPFNTGTMEFKIEDDGAVWKEKLTKTLRADFNPLRANESVTIKHKLDRADSWTTQTESTTDKMKTRLPINLGDRNKEYQVAVDLEADGSTSPEVLGVAVETHLNREENSI